MNFEILNEIIHALNLLCSLYISYKTTSIEIWGLCVVFVLCGQLPVFLFNFCKNVDNRQNRLFVVNIGILILSVTTMLNTLVIISDNVFWLILPVELYLFSLSSLFVQKKIYKKKIILFSVIGLALGLLLASVLL